MWNNPPPGGHHGYRFIHRRQTFSTGIPCHSLDRLDDHTFTTSLGKTGLDDFSPFVWWGSSSVWESFLLEKIGNLWILWKKLESLKIECLHVYIASKVDGFPAPLCISFTSNYLYYHNLWMHTPKSSCLYPLQVKNKKHQKTLSLVPGCAFIFLSCISFSAIISSFASRSSLSACGKR